MLWLPLFCLSEFVERIAAALLYPVVYPLRKWVRSGVVLWPGFLYKPRFWVVELK